MHHIQCHHIHCHQLNGQINTLRPRQNGRHFADDIFKCIFRNENVWIPITISLKFVPKGPINNIPALVQIMAWRRPGDKPLSETMMVRLPTHICVTRPQLVNPGHICKGITKTVYPQMWYLDQVMCMEGGVYDILTSIINFYVSRLT